MTGTSPILFQWDGEAMVPRRPRIADKHFVVGQIYPLEVREDRSHVSHAHYFACIANAWQNLPEDLAERFRNPDALRKFALIKAGYRDERSIACASKAEAQRLAAFIEPMDSFAVVVVSEATVSVFTAKSQSMRAMGKVEFQKSKDAVLDVLAKMLGTTAAELGRSEAA